MPTTELGIDLDFYWHPDTPVSAAITADAQYARELGANSVLISFPFYSVGGVVVGGAATPSPAAIEQAVTAARAEGLQVGIRPLLDETNLGRARTYFQPSRPGQMAAVLCDIPCPVCAGRAGYRGV